MKKSQQFTFAIQANAIYRRAIKDYHITDSVDAPLYNPYGNTLETLEELLYYKCWIDTVQWHLEDLIRDPNIDPVEALTLKRRIDKSNQERTDVVEKIDDYFAEKFSHVKPHDDATLNTESPAWAFDRLSILAVKIWHMEEQTKRTDVTNEHIATCKNKLAVLLEQQEDLTTAIDWLLEDISGGRKYMKLYRQMKMYNDPTTNPVLYGKTKS